MAEKDNKHPEALGSVELGTLGKGMIAGRVAAGRAAADVFIAKKVPRNNKT